MTKLNLRPVILAGGQGARLWPISRKSNPKQFANLFGEQSLFQSAVLRAVNGDAVTSKKPIVLINADFVSLVKEQMSAIDIEPETLIIEPEPKNTGPALLATCFHCMNEDPDMILLSLPSDHLIESNAAFFKAIDKAIHLVDDGKIVAFGISPTRPDTGFGYLELGKTILEGAANVTRFIEKPDQIRAEKIFSSGNYLWNAGIFMFRPRDLIQAFRMHSASLTENVSLAVNEGTVKANQLWLASEPWKKCESISIDFAVMEKTQNLVSVFLDTPWSDLGSWNSVMNEMSKETDGMVMRGTTTQVNCSNSMLWSTNSDIELVGVGLENIVAVAMPDAFLVLNNSSSQNVKEALNRLDKKNALKHDSKEPKSHHQSKIISSPDHGEYQILIHNLGKGEKVDPETNFVTHTFWTVLSGELLLNCNQQNHCLEVGETFKADGGVEISLINAGEERLTVLQVFGGK